MAREQLAHLEIDSVDVIWQLYSLRGAARIHAPWRFELSCAAPSPGATSVDDLLGKRATLSWNGAGEAKRTFDGIIEAVHTRRTVIDFVMVPKLALLDYGKDHRIFVEQDSLTIVESLLGEHGISLQNRVIRSLPKRAQCVQAFESDLAFIRRLLAEEGIAFYLSCSDRDTLVVTDHPDGFAATPDMAPLPVREQGGLMSQEALYGVSVQRTMSPTMLSFRDYNFEQPELDQLASCDNSGATREQYEYPGWYATPDVGQELAAQRLDQWQQDHTVLRAQSSCRLLWPGYVIELDSENERQSGHFLIVELNHAHDDSDDGAEDGQTQFRAELVAVPAKNGYRPKRPNPPRLGGVQTATVTGKSGSEIHTEEHGRIKLQHRWDRLGAMDDKSSTWVRVVQPPTSGGFFLPRVGWEVLLSFHERSLDRPLVIGRLYNGAKTPPEALPGKKVVSAFGTLTTPGGGSINGIRMNDAAGAEQMSFTASKDFNERTENDKNTSITSTDTWTIGANRNVIVGQVFDQAVSGAQSYSVAASREVNVTSNKVVNAASESIAIGGVRLLDIGGDLQTGCSSLTRLVGAAKAELGIEHVNRAVQGAATTLVGGSWGVRTPVSNGVSVAGASTELVSGPKSIKCLNYSLIVKGGCVEKYASRSINAGADRAEGFGAAASYKISGSATIKGADVTVKASAKLTIKAGGVTVSMTPGSIKVSGNFKSAVDAIDKGKVDYE